MFRFLLGLVVGLAAGYKGTEYWLQRREELNREQEDLIEIDQIPLPTSST